MDVYGPMKTPFRQGEKYLIKFKDIASRNSFVLTITNRSQVVEYLERR